MISGTCLVCDHQGVPHRVFCDVTTGKRQPARPEIEHLRYRLEGVLAVTLTLGPGMPDGLCLRCEKGLCDIESRVRGFRESHHATREKYRQLTAAGDSFICDLTRLHTRHQNTPQEGSETRTETSLSETETETYPPQLVAGGCGVWQGGGGGSRGGDGGGEGVGGIREMVITPQSAFDCVGAQSYRPTTTAAPLPPPPPAAAALMPNTATHRQGLTGIGPTDNSSSTSMGTGSSLSKPPQNITSPYDNSTDRTLRGYDKQATTTHRGSVNGNCAGGPEDSAGNTLDRVNGHCNVDNTNMAADHSANGGHGEVHAGINEHTNSGYVNHSNSTSHEHSDSSCRRLDTPNGITATYNGQIRRIQESGESCMEAGKVSGHHCSTQGGDHYSSDASYKSCCCSASQQPNHAKPSMDSGVQSEPLELDLRQSQVSVRDDDQDDTMGLVLDLTVPRSLSSEAQNTKDLNVNHGINEPLMVTKAHELEQSGKPYLVTSGQGGEWKNSNNFEKMVMEGPHQAPRQCSKAPPPLIHMSLIKKEPIDDDDVPIGKRHMSSLDYLEKMPYCIAPIEDSGEKVGPGGQFYDDGYLSEPPHKRYKYSRWYSVPEKEPAAQQQLPILNTHVSATLNVSHAGDDPDKNIAGQTAPDMNHNSSTTEAVQTTTIQGTIRIPLNQLRNIEKGPANISLMTEATVNSSFAPNGKQKPSQDQSQHQERTQQTAKIPVNMKINGDDLNARIPLHEAFLDRLQSQCTHSEHSTPSHRVLHALRTQRIPAHHSNNNGHSLSHNSVSGGYFQKGAQPPEWKRMERLVEGANMVNIATTNANLLRPQLGLEVAGPRGQGHRLHGQGHVGPEKHGSTDHMTSFSWQQPQFRMAVRGQGQGQSRYPGPLQNPNMLLDVKMSQGQSQQRSPHPSMPQGHSQSQQGQPGNQPNEGQTQGQGQKERSLSQHRGQEQSNQGHNGQGQGQLDDREPGHLSEGQAVQKTPGYNINQLDTPQTRGDSEDEDDDEEEGKLGTDLDLNTNNHTSRHDTSGRRQLLRPWLEERLNRGNIPGFQWVDKERNLFKIPWKHRSKNDWSPDNCTIFMEWALHTGKHRVGIDKPDYCRWKTRLRCAFNQAADIQERKDLNKMKCSEPYKVYEFLSKSDIKPKPPPKPKVQLDLGKMPVQPTTTILTPGVAGMAPHSATSTDNVPHCVTTFHTTTKNREIYTAVAGALMAVGGSSVQNNRVNQSSVQLSTVSSHQHHHTRPTATSPDQASPTTTKIAGDPYPAQPVSVPVHTNNNKFSWDTDLDDEPPLVIDLDRADQTNDDECRDNLHDDQNSEALHPDNRHNREIPRDDRLSYIHKHQLAMSGDRPYICDLCQGHFPRAEALIEHRGKIHGVFNDTGCANRGAGSIPRHGNSISRTLSYVAHQESIKSNGPIRDLDTECQSNLPITEGNT